MIQRMSRHLRIRLLFVLAIFLLSSVSLAAEPYHGKVVGISDGDTIKVLHEGTQVKIRLYGIDTPEKRQAFGNRAKQFTADRVFRKTVKVVPMDTDRYGVALVQPLDAAVMLNEALVRHGYAWATVNIARLSSALGGWSWNGGPRAVD